MAVERVEAASSTGHRGGEPEKPDNCPSGGELLNSFAGRGGWDRRFQPEPKSVWNDSTVVGILGGLKGTIRADRNGVAASRQRKDQGTRGWTKFDQD